MYLFLREMSSSSNIKGGFAETPEPSTERNDDDAPSVSVAMAACVIALCVKAAGKRDDKALGENAFEIA